MNRLLPLLLALAPACHSTHHKDAAPEAAPTSATRFVYRAAVTTVPAGAERVEVAITLPSGVDELRTSGLVGNEGFELVMAREKEGVRELGSGSVHWTTLDEKGAPGQKQVRIETDGKALELGLSFALATAPADRELEAELRRGSSVQVNGRPAEGLWTRLERVR